MGDALFALKVLGVVLAIFLAGLAYVVFFSRRSRQSRETLEAWACANGYELLSEVMDPVMFSNEWSTFAYTVRLRRPDRSEARAWVVAGGLFGRPMRTDDVFVKWLGDS